MHYGRATNECEDSATPRDGRRNQTHLYISRLSSSADYTARAPFVSLRSDDDGIALGPVRLGDGGRRVRLGRVALVGLPRGSLLGALALSTLRLDGDLEVELPALELGALVLLESLELVLVRLEVDKREALAPARLLAKLERDDDGRLDLALRERGGEHLVRDAEVEVADKDERLRLDAGGGGTTAARLAGLAGLGGTESRRLAIGCALRDLAVGASLAGAGLAGARLAGAGSTAILKVRVGELVGGIGDGVVADRRIAGLLSFLVVARRTRAASLGALRRSTASIRSSLFNGARRERTGLRAFFGLASPSPSPASCAVSLVAASSAAFFAAFLGARAAGGPSYTGMGFATSTLTWRPEISVLSSCETADAASDSEV